MGQGISQVSPFHILFHRVIAGFMAISHPFSQNHTFCRDLFFLYFHKFFTGFFHMPLKNSVKTVHLFTWFSHAIHIVFHRVTPSNFHGLFHILLCEIPCEKGEPVSHGFHTFLTGFFHSFFHMPVKNPVKYSVKTV